MINLIKPTSELLLGLGVTSHSVIDPGISSTIGMSSTTALLKDSSIASCDKKFDLIKFNNVFDNEFDNEIKSN